MNQLHILLRSSWQSVNIGDIAHTPGMLRLLEEHCPHARVSLWPCDVGRGVREMLERNFPNIEIVEGELDHGGDPSTPALRRAWHDADLLLHGSGPSVVREQDLTAWAKQTGKPFGALGVTIENLNDDLRALLQRAAFAFLRDSISLQFLHQESALASITEFAPDATFAFHLRADARADEYLRRVELKEKKFVCAIPRLRYAPYHQVHETSPTLEDARRAAISAQFVDSDHATLRDAMIAFVRATKMKVLVCPEMTYPVALGKKELVDFLPDDVKPFVVWRDEYWRPDEAASVYSRALALVSFEMHSPILALAGSTPDFRAR